MAGGYRYDPPPGVQSFLNDGRKLKEQVKALAKTVPGIGIVIDTVRNALVVGGGRSIALDDGGSVLVNGGTVQVFDPDGNLAVFAGTSTLTGHTGLATVRPDGSTSLNADDSAGGFAGFYDRAGRIVFSDDAVSGHGLATPYIPAGTFVDITVPTATTDSASFTPLQWAVSYQQNPLVVADILVYTPADTSGEVRITDGSGAQIGDTLTIAVNSFGGFRIGPAAWPSFAFSGNVIPQIEARVTAGSGSIGVRGLGFWGVQS